MINTKELRRLAQAAKHGPDGVSLNWLKLLQDFQKEANPAVIDELLDRLEAEESKQAALLECLNEWKELAKSAEKERDELRANVEAREQQEPAGTLHDDGYFVWSPRCRPASNYVGWKTKLYALPGAKGE